MDFSRITDKMINGLSGIERKKFDFVKESIEAGGLVSPLVVRWFSELGFMLAWDSMESGRGIEIARPLGEIFDGLVKSTRISIETKAQLRDIIADGKIDFRYASGDHNIVSLRLAPQIGR